MEFSASFLGVPVNTLVFNQSLMLWHVSVFYVGMKHAPLKNYLRTCRRRLALSQEDVALLLGLTRRTVVSYHELGTHMPSLERALGYALILGVPVHELFAETYQQLEEEVASRAHQLFEELREDAATGLIQRKLETLSNLTSGTEHLIIPVCQE